MNDDQLLKDLARAALEEKAEELARLDPRWDRLSEGTLSEEEQEALAARAEASPEARQVYEAFRPLDAAFRARVVAALQDSPATVRRQRARILPFGRRSVNRAGWLAAAAALAALVLVLVRGPDQELPSLPPYAVVGPHGSLQRIRSDEPGTPTGEPVFARGSRFELRLIPDTNVSGAVEARYFLEQDDELTQWEVVDTVSATGAVSLDGILGRDFEIEPGRWTLWVVVGRPGELPDADGLRPYLEEGATRRPRWMLLVTRAFRVQELSVEYSGCETVLEGPRCALGESRELHLWVADPAAEIEVTVGGRSLSATAADVAGGKRLTLQVPGFSSRVTRLRVVAPKAQAEWDLELTDDVLPSWYAEAAALSCDPLEDFFEHGDHGASGTYANLRLRLRGRCEWKRGELESATRFLDQAADAHREAGWWLYEIEDATLSVHVYMTLRRFADARQRIDRLVLPAQAPAEAYYHVSYYLGLLAMEVGDLRSALEHLGEAAERAERVGMKARRFETLQMVAVILQVLGRSQEAAALLDEIDDDPPPNKPCAWATFLENRAWTLLLAREAGESAENPVPLLLEARKIYENELCAQANDVQNVLTNLALALLQASQPDRVREVLAQVEEPADGAPLQQMWRTDIEGRLDLDEGRPAEALQHFESLAEQATRHLSPGIRWQALVGQARAHESMGDLGAALEALTKAEKALETQSLDVPIYEGREMFLARREAGARWHVELLLRSGLTEKALAVARASRSRMLRSLRRGDRLARLTTKEREGWYQAIGEFLNGRAELARAVNANWELPADQRRQAEEQQRARGQQLLKTLDDAYNQLGEQDTALPAPRPGELVLAYYPVTDGWVGFATDGRHVGTHPFQLPDGPLEELSAQLSDRLLRPFESEIESASRVRVLPYGRLREVDFHALPFGSDILLGTKPVVYALDLVASARTPQKGPLRALVVADPRSDLLAARREADLVKQVLASSTSEWHVAILQGESATEEAIRSALPGLDLLHYAGHGVFRGLGGWESALLLAEHTKLTPGHILALEPTPEWVVLSGCETARTQARASIESIGLAQAFIIAGTRQAIAAVRPVADDTAYGLIERLYRQWSSEPDLAVLLQQAQLEWRARDPTADWASFRVLEP